MAADPVVAREAGSGLETLATHPHGDSAARAGLGSYRGPRLVSFGSIPARTFSVGQSGVLDGGTGMFTMNTSP